MKLEFVLNGKWVITDVNPTVSVLELLRRDQRLTGPKCGCNKGECGACTILVDGRSHYACSLFAFQIQGRQIETIEGLYDESRDVLHPVQESLIKTGAVGCGYCLSGVTMMIAELLSKNLAPEDAEIRECLSGVSCRCGLYEKYIQSVRGLRLPPADGKGKAKRF